MNSTKSTPLFTTLALLATASLASTAGCTAAAGADVVENGSEADLRAQSACGRISYESALLDYQAAVSAAKKLQAGGRASCAEESDELVDDAPSILNIATKAAGAVDECAAFKNVFASSPEAAPVREVLKENLSYGFITGAITEQWEGLEAALSAGVQLHGQAPEGGETYRSTLTFAPNGRAVMSVSVPGESGSAPTITPFELTYRIGRKTSTGGVEIVLAGYRNSAAYFHHPVTVELKRLRAPIWDGTAPAFDLKIDGETFFSFPEECTAG